MVRYIFCLFVFIIATANSFSQSQIERFLKPSDTLNPSRRTAVYISEAAIGGLTLIGLHQLWYADYEQSRFHTINDNNEWLQMDKVGHVYASYQLGRLGASALQWSGASRNEQLLYGAKLGFTFLTAVEVLDGFSKEWGFSWGDMAANVAGSGIYIGQELLWEEQRITLKYSFHQTRYAQLQPTKLGNGLTEEFLKDYNGQTYWLSFNLQSFFKTEHIPKWLNVALGYGADGMLFDNPESHSSLDASKNRMRQYYLSLDVDLTRIETKSPLLRSVFEVLNLIKVPLPTVEFNGKKGLKLHGVYF
ncbi:DUF2279 domain-containing protein [Gelidibacter salicanalis]|uniref:DUF2279 domain-containing protein n=1 Tax=Gelidibacter salicanalis TaxID=291193 RepID=A0A5C7AH37_9FLAO|nr:DUF2279 domain-containing protein [Gelidibacter salicanalis]TXE07647.1 DUF2279 domain-containing protein [Gelidibacter salicanalis]